MAELSGQLDIRTCEDKAKHLLTSCQLNYTWIQEPQRIRVRSWSALHMRQSMYGSNLPDIGSADLTLLTWVLKLSNSMCTLWTTLSSSPWQSMCMMWVVLIPIDWLAYFWSDTISWGTKVERWTRIYSALGRLNAWLPIYKICSQIANTSNFTRSLCQQLTDSRPCMLYTT